MPEPKGAVAEAIGGTDFVGDMTREGDVQALIELAEETYGAVDVFCSNAGIIRLGGEDAPDAEWQLCWDLHLMAHVYAARLLAPKMAERGDGYFVNTASAAGLLSHPNSATYAVTKHAAVAFAEWLAINYGDKGVKASVL
ncbi:MAG: SDR family oxidoreductase, partial [Rhodospirillaceae bacterium]